MRMRMQIDRSQINGNLQDWKWHICTQDGQVEVPEVVKEHEQELNSRPLMDYGFDVDLLQMWSACFL
jgi:hypothetical protein